MKKTPKIPRRTPNAPAKVAPPSALVTGDDYLGEGTEEEESGDRWLSLDLAKALRFYQRAYDHYETARALDPGLLDAHYNAARLAFHVYNQYTKPDHVRFTDMENVGDVLGSSQSVVQSLERIVTAHELVLALSRAQGVPPGDCLYNTALAYTEILEQAVERELPLALVETLAERTRDLLLEVLQGQTVELSQATEREGLRPGTRHAMPSPNGLAFPSSNGLALPSSTGLTPVLMVETLLLAYRFVQSVFEAVPLARVAVVHLAMAPFLTLVDAWAASTIASYGPERLDLPPELRLTPELLEELAVARAYVDSASQTTLEALSAVWGRPDLPHSPERYMAAADSMQSLLDKECMGPSPHAFLPRLHLNEPERAWELLGAMGDSYKKAQDLLADRMKRYQSANSLLLSPVIATLSALMTARSDCQLQRALLEYPAAVQNRAVLLGNARTLLVNAINTASISGGLREGAGDKLVRAKRRVEAILRRCLMDGEGTPAQLDRYMKRSQWEPELNEINDLGYYGYFSVQGD